MLRMQGKSMPIWMFGFVHSTFAWMAHELAPSVMVGVESPAPTIRDTRQTENPAPEAGFSLFVGRD